MDYDYVKNVALPIVVLIATIYLSMAALYGSFILFESAFQAGDVGMLIVAAALVPIIYVIRDWLRDNIAFFEE